ncbi:MAG TPA: Gfo/Idh/MocA family oxidoreductase, partial [Fimbriimonadaceae bacterium]|nr:Gfo/Idh/MocA family oxidoreductase [Fimbriimonadaceae bacterium]
MTNEKTTTTRRQFLAAAGGVAAASVLPGVAKGFHNSVDDTIRVALVGCGGRGSGAAVNAVSAKGGKVKLIAMADVFEDRLSSSFDNLQRAIGDKMDVPNDRKFLGFDAYQHAMNVLRPGDVVILTTPPAFRWVHYTYAIKLGINVFMEKPLAVDGPAARRMLELNKQAMAKDMKVGVGLMSRHCTGMEELHDRIKDGAIGDIILMRGYRMHGPAGSAFSLPKPDDMTHLEYHIRRFHSFLWASGGCFNDFYIHHVDHLSWMKDMWPQKAQAVGGRHY